MDNLDGFKKVPMHDKFLGKLLFENAGDIINVQMAYIEPSGGGSTDPNHIHDYDHLFIVLDGECLVKEGTKQFTLRKNECARVSGRVPHSTWNTGNDMLRMIGICVRTEQASEL